MQQRRKQHRDWFTGLAIRPAGPRGKDQASRQSLRRSRAQIAAVTVGALAAIWSAALLPSLSRPRGQVWAADAVAPPAAATPAAANAGAAPAPELFTQHCASCHGSGGAGDGPAAHLVYPKPRNFTAGVFRFKSTPGSQLPSNDDLLRVINNGVPRTAMPGFAKVLTAPQIQDLASYVLSLNQSKEKPENRQPITIPAAPEFTAALIQQGQALYQAAGCAACHGAGGQGDGPSSLTLKDSDGLPLPPADFTVGVFKAGREVQDLYRTIVIGVPSTPMPSFLNTLGQLKVPGVDEKTDRIWALVAYLRSMEEQREPHGEISGVQLRAEPAADQAMLENVEHPAWDKLPASALRLQPLWQRKSGARSLQVRVVRGSKQIGVLLSWPDETVDAIEGSVHGFSDSVAVMYALGGKAPALTMGAQAPAQSDGLVNIWQWKASRALDAKAGHLHDNEGAKGKDLMPSDMYMMKKGDMAQGPLTEHDAAFISAWQAGNPHADPALLGRSCLESNAVGFGSLTLQKFQEQNVTGLSQWVNGQWRVLLVRDLAADGDGDVQLASGAAIPLAFAVWDGHAGDRNGTKLISDWHFLTVQGQ